MRLPLEWNFEGDTPPLVGTASSSQTTIKLYSENGGGTITYEVTEILPQPAGKAIFQQIGSPLYNAIVDEIRVPVSTDTIYAGYKLDRPVIYQVNAWARISLNSTADTAALTFPDGYYYSWRTRDDLIHYVALDVSGMTPSEGEFIILDLDATHYKQPTRQVKIVFDNAAPKHVMPAVMPNHRPSKRLFLEANAPAPVYEMDPLTAEWSASGYNEAGDAVFGTLLPSGNAVNNDLFEAGYYCSEELNPTQAKTPHAIATDAVGPHLLLSSAKLDTPIVYTNPDTLVDRAYYYQSAVFQAKTMTDMHMRTGMWRFVVSMPSRTFAWPAIWCIAIDENGKSKWPPEIDILEMFGVDEFLSGYFAAHNQHNGYFGKSGIGRISVFASAHDNAAMQGAAAPNYFTDAVELVLTIDEDAQEITVFVDGIEVYSALWAAQHEDPKFKDYKFFPIATLAISNKNGLDAYDDGTGSMRWYGLSRYEITDFAALEVTPLPPVSLNLLASFDANKGVTEGEGGASRWDASGGSANFLEIGDSTRRPELKLDSRSGSKFLEFRNTDTVTSGELLTYDMTAISLVTVMRIPTLTATPKDIIYYNNAYGMGITVEGSDLRFSQIYRDDTEDLGRAVGVIPEGETFALAARCENNGNWSVRINGVEVASGTTTLSWAPAEAGNVTRVETLPMDMFYMGIADAYLSNIDVAALEDYAALVSRREDLLA